MSNLWTITEDKFNPTAQAHQETIFTIGNGYLCTRGVLEEGYPGQVRATLVHGVFDAAPIVFTELANAPDWLPLIVYLDGDRFRLDRGELLEYKRILDLRTAVLTRQVRWRSPGGRVATLTYERFASLADPHTLYIRCSVLPEFDGVVEFRAAVDGRTDNLGLVHWDWLEQGEQKGCVYLRNRSRASKIDIACAMRLQITAGKEAAQEFWDVENRPTFVTKVEAKRGQAVTAEKVVTVYTSRDVPTEGTVDASVARNSAAPAWTPALDSNGDAWEREWERTDVVIEGDEEAQRAVRFCLYHLLIAAPRIDDRVSIPAKTLSGFGYRGHVFWDTEVFMLPVFTHTGADIAKNLLNYRYQRLPSARRKALSNGYEGAQFPWESADTGDEVTPSFVPDSVVPTRLVRIWTGEIELHISADIAYAAYQYWKMTGDDDWFVERGAELVIDTAKFWASRAEWNESAGRYEYKNVIGPDEYHDHVDNNAFTNRMAQWNLETAFQVLDWLKGCCLEQFQSLTKRLDLTPESLLRWHDVIDKTYIPREPSGLFEQFDGYFQRRDVDLATLEPRSISVQQLLGIEGANQTQVLKQPDVLMLLYLLRDYYSDETVRLNYDYYNPRTDHTYGSSLGPAVMAIMACRVGQVEEAYEQFMRAVRADLLDVRGNAKDGIHGASAAGTWHAVVFGFAGLKVTPDGWSVEPKLPSHWKRLAFKFSHHGQLQTVDVKH